MKFPRCYCLDDFYGFDDETNGENDQSHTNANREDDSENQYRIVKQP